VEGCGKVLMTELSFKKHGRSHRRRRHMCTLCGRRFPKKKALRSHEYTAHTGGEKPYRCSREGCNKEFLWPCQLKRHEHYHDKKYECTSVGCAEQLGSWKQLVRHRRQHHNAKRHACTECGIKFLTNSALKVHRKVHGETRDVFHCPFEDCPRFYYFRRNLDSHIRSSHEGRGFICTVDTCRKKLSTKQKLEQHACMHNPAYRGRRAPKKGAERRRRWDQGLVRGPVLSAVEHLTGRRSRVEESESDSEQESDAAAAERMEEFDVAVAKLKESESDSELEQESDAAAASERMEEFDVAALARLEAELQQDGAEGSESNVAVAKLRGSVSDSEEKSDAAAVAKLEESESDVAVAKMKESESDSEQESDVAVAKKLEESESNITVANLKESESDSEEESSVAVADGSGAERNEEAMTATDEGEEDAKREAGEVKEEAMTGPEDNDEEETARSETDEDMFVAPPPAHAPVLIDPDELARTVAGTERLAWQCPQLVAPARLAQTRPSRHGPAHVPLMTRCPLSESESESDSYFGVCHRTSDSG